MSFQVAIVRCSSAAFPSQALKAQERQSGRRRGLRRKNASARRKRRLDSRGVRKIVFIGSLEQRKREIMRTSRAHVSLGHDRSDLRFEPPSLFIYLSRRFAFLVHYGRSQEVIFSFRREYIRFIVLPVVWWRWWFKNSRIKKR